MARGIYCDFSYQDLEFYNITEELFSVLKLTSSLRRVPSAVSDFAIFAKKMAFAEKRSSCCSGCLNSTVRQFG